MAEIKGQFRLFPDSDKEIIVPNNIPQEGRQLILKSCFRDDQTDVASGGNYYIGLGNFVYDPTVGMATLGGELTVTNGYARQAITRDVTGWPTIQQIQSAYMLTSIVVNFGASGGDFSGVFNRMFLCTHSSGTGGKLIAVSSALLTPQLITDGMTLPMSYDIYFQ